ncbi:MAG: UDP-N-acetylmuramoyl-tripeptide--D-alanyl-D-alanine ligase [Bacteroidetes bacterium]|nr:UDP-N-acetylmuramoyl-tripeptide--D-alanyl-D-alanine ligase [Bacteroidota bacterium]
MTFTELYEVFLENPHIQTDTRKLQKGDIYFALKGPSFNGNEFAEQALSLGAAFAIVDEAEWVKNDRCLLVSNVLQTLQELARHHRRQYPIPFLAITGSNGKTTTKELVVSVLKKHFQTYATSGNLNNHIGVPLTILSIKNDVQFAVIEMGANHLGEIASYCAIAEPSHGLITNCGKAHIEGFGSEAGVRKGKGELFDYLRANSGCIFRNIELPYLKEMAIGIEEQITYGPEEADINGKAEMDGIFLKVNIEHDGRVVPINTNLVGAYNYPNVMAAVAVGLSFGISIDKIAEGISSYHPDNSRSQAIRKGSNQIILDAYNANPSSMKLAIESFAAAPLPHKILWLGAMKELGVDTEEDHANIVNLVGQYPWELVLFVGPEFEKVHGSYLWFANSEEASHYIKTAAPKNASILIKGSRGSKMELLLQALPE